MTSSTLVPVLVLGVLGIAYAVFVFVSEQANPWRLPPAPLRRHRWRYGRRLGTVALVSLALAVWLPMATPVTAIAGLVLGGVTGTIAAAVAVVAHRRGDRHRLWEAHGERPAAPAVAAVAAVMDAPDRSTPPRRVDIEI